MTSTVPEREPLGNATLNRKWYLDVDTSSTSTPTWIGVFGMTDFKPALDTTLQDDSDFDSEGYKSQTATALAWSNEAKVSRKTQPGAAEEYDPGQEVLRLAGAEIGPDNVVHVRWYEMTPGGPRTEAYEGYSSVSWSDDGGGMDALSTATVKLTGRGQRIAIAHPDGDD